MGRAIPRSRLGVFRRSWIAAEIALVGLLIGSTGVLGAVRDRWDTLSEPPAARGARIYQMQCFGCHGGESGGAITDRPPKHNARGHTWHHADCELAAMIGRGIAPDMPAYGGRLDAEEIRAVITHIRTMWTAEQRTQQEDLTRARC
ncbi:MAG: cytochrome c [Chloroflexi bacterium]|nr:cytochrome c [Chloroflexota bacterium]